MMHATGVASSERPQVVVVEHVVLSVRSCYAPVASVCMATTLQHCCYLHDRPCRRPTRLARQCLNCRRFFFLNRRAALSAVAP